MAPNRNGGRGYDRERITFNAYLGSTAIRLMRHGWRASLNSHSIPARRIHIGARGTRPVR
jgi:hypothetical protein